MYLVVCAILVLVAQLTNAEVKFKCPLEDVTKFDHVTAQIISLNQHQRRFPESKSGIEQYCRETKADLVTTLDLINKCFIGSTKQFSTIIHYSVKKVMNLHCGKNKKRIDQLLNMAKCANRNEKSLNKCLSSFTDTLTRGKRAEPSNTRIGYACCDYYKFLNCFTSTTKSTCSAKQSEAMEEFIRNIFQSIIDVACGDFTENSDKCDRLAPPPKKKKSDKSTRTFFLPLVELWNNLE